MRAIFAFFASLGVLGLLLQIAISCAVVYVYLSGVVFGFHHGIILGLVSFIPPVGFIEGLLHLFGVV